MGELISIHSTHNAMLVHRSALVLLVLSGMLNAGQGSAARVSFDKDVLPIFQQACAKCHLGDGQTATGHGGGDFARRQLWCVDFAGEERGQHAGKADFGLDRCAADADGRRPAEQRAGKCDSRVD